MKRALAWVRRHGRTNREHPPLHPPRFLLSRAGFGSVNPAKDPSQSPVPLSLARARDLSQAFRRLNGLKRHTGAHLPVIPNSMHLRAETFPPHLDLSLAGKTRLQDTRGKRGRTKDCKVYSKNKDLRFDFIQLKFYFNSNQY